MSVKCKHGNEPCSCFYCQEESKAYWDSVEKDKEKEFLSWLKEYLESEFEDSYPYGIKDYDEMKRLLRELIG